MGFLCDCKVSKWGQSKEKRRSNSWFLSGAEVPTSHVRATGDFGVTRFGQQGRDADSMAVFSLSFANDDGSGDGFAGALIVPPVVRQ